MKAFLTLASLLATLAALPAQAGPLSELYQQALANDPQLKAAEARFQAEREVLPQSRAALLPTLGFSAELTHSDSDSALRGDGESRSGSLSLTQPLFRADRWYRYQRGKTLGERALLTLTQAEQALILRSVEIYLDALEARTNLIAAQAQEKAIKRRLEQVQLQFEVGLNVITDVQEAQAAYDSAQVSRILAEGALDNSYEALERLAGTTPTPLAQLSADYPLAGLQPGERESWVKKALQGNLALGLSALESAAAQQQARAERAGHYPSLDLQAAYSDQHGGLAEGQAGSIGLVFNLPLYQGGAISSRQREAEALWQAAQQQQEDSRRRVIQDTRSLFRNLRTDLLAIKAQQQALISAETALEATAAGFEVGTRNVVDVLEAERQLFTSRRDLANARHQYLRNLFRFRQVLGTLAPEDLEELDRWLVPADPA